MTLEPLELLDWKRRIFDVYRRVRLASDAKQAWANWRAVRDELFATHPQSPLPEAERATFQPLPYFDYDVRARVLAAVEQAAPVSFDLATNRGSSYRFTRFGVASFELYGHMLALELYWLEGYAGGVFLPFGDTTNGKETYGAGRYLLDTAKGADLGTERDRLVLDFNFAFNPSCAYDPRWVCPLPPAANRLRLAIRVGERLPELSRGAPVHGSESEDMVPVSRLPCAPPRTGEGLVGGTLLTGVGKKTRTRFVVTHSGRGLRMSLCMSSRTSPVKGCETL